MDAEVDLAMLRRMASYLALIALLAACAPTPTLSTPAAPSETPVIPPTHTPRSVSTLPVPTFPPLTLPIPTQMTPADEQTFALPVDDPIVQQAIADLAARLNIAPDAITVLSVEAVTWPDSSLGCPQPGMAYLQVLVEGLRIRLSAEGALYEYHSGENIAPFLCQPSRYGLGSPIPVPTARPYPIPPPEEGTEK